VPDTNGTTTAAYLAKSGLKVCVLEERPECGGAQEDTDVRAGINSSPHPSRYMEVQPGLGSVGVMEIRGKNGLVSPEAQRWRLSRLENTWDFYARTEPSRPLARISRAG